jgi:multiple sugar transport system substrate-binding protein
MNTVKTKFELLNPDIQIELVASPPNWAYNERLSILIASGNAPDVFYGAADKSSYILNGWAMDITELLNRDRVEMGLNDFFPGVFDASTRMGRNYGVPAMAMSQALFYNKTLFDEVGLAEPPSDWNDKKWNWDAFMAAAKKLTRLGADGRTDRVALTYVRVEDLAWMFGGDWFPKEAYETNIATHSTLVSNENVAAYTAKQQLYVDLRATAVSPNSGVKSSTGFQQGLAAMDWGGWWKAGS